MKRAIFGILLLTAAAALAPPAFAAPQSQNVVIIGGGTLNMGHPCYGSYTAANYMGDTYGGCLDLTGFVGVNFTPMMPGAVSAASLAPFDTAVLNMAAYYMYCSSNSLTPTQQQAIVNWVATGKKLIIFDSECSPGPNYSWLPYPFTTSNPGAYGASGTVVIVENNSLSSNNPADPSYFNAAQLTYTDAVGDMNAVTTYNPNWCLDMVGTNTLGVKGAGHTYAKYPTGMDKGLIIYNGFDQDYQEYLGTGSAELTKIWRNEIMAPFNPSNLPCGFVVTGLKLAPPYTLRQVGTPVPQLQTATATDLLNNPVSGRQTTVQVTGGPNLGQTITANTDAAGHVTLSYLGGIPGTDTVNACFGNHIDTVNLVCAAPAKVDWIDCRFDTDNDVDLDDLNLQRTALNQNVSTNPSILRYDVDGDGWVTTNDVRRCSQVCTRAKCATY